MIIVRIVQFVKIVQLVQQNYYGYIKFFGGFVGTWVGAFTVEVSIHELLAAAREAVKSDYIKGESILCETRYHPDTHYMVEIEMLKTDNTLGKKGAHIRKFLTEDEYSAMLQKQEEHLIKIKRQAIVQKGTLRYTPLPDRLDSRRERGIFLPAGKEQ